MGWGPLPLTALELGDCAVGQAALAGRKAVWPSMASADHMICISSSFVFRDNPDRGEGARSVRACDLRWGSAFSAQCCCVAVLYKTRGSSLGHLYSEEAVTTR